MRNHKKIIELITEIKNSHSIMETIFLNGSCCNFYFILKTVFPKAEAYFNHDHVVTKINGKYYDITGEINPLVIKKEKYTPITRVYSDKYKTDDCLKMGEMYSIAQKPKLFFQ